MPGMDGLQDPLLAPDALKGVRIAISVSESPDLFRLGLVETHFRLALAEIARSVLVGGGKLVYGGHLDPDGYTVMLLHELQRYSRRDRPLLICLAWQEHRKLSQDEFNGHKRDLGLFGEIICLDPHGRPINWNTGRGVDPEPVGDDQVRQTSLTSLRRYMTANTNGRVLIGGRRSGFQGRYPGLLEEAIISVEHDQPLYLAGGFGGVTSDIIAALGIDNMEWLPTRPDAPQPDDRLTVGLEQLSKIITGSKWKGLNNGLTGEENRLLAATHRPTEIAALVALGLGRRFAHK